MNYNKIYQNIIDSRINNTPSEYYEIHHIIPRCLGGTDEKTNLVKLTAREHFVCHWLLIKIHKNTPNYYKMIKSFFMMGVISDNQNRYITSRKYEKLKDEYSKYMSKSQMGENNTQYGTRWITNIKTKESYKLDKNVDLPIDCIEGRNKKYKICKCCKIEFMPQRNAIRCCSIECSKRLISDASKIQNRQYKNGITVSVDGVIYDSISRVADFLNMNHETARLRFKSDKFPTWKIIENADV